MTCKEIIYSEHAITQMFARYITKSDVKIVIDSGEEIISYPDDQPFPSKLMLGFTGGRPIHIIVAYDEVEKRCI